MAKLRIFQIAKELNISHTDIVSFLTSKNGKVDFLRSRPGKPKNTTEKYRKMLLTFEILIFCERLNEPSKRKYPLIYVFREATRKYSFLTSKSGKVDFLRSRPGKTKKYN